MKEKSRLIGPILLVFSAGLLILSEFVPWVGSYSLLEMYRFYSLIEFPILYLFPIFSAIVIVLSLVGLLVGKPSSYKYFYILLFIAINLLFIFFIQMLNVHGSFLWNHLGIYIGLLASGSLFLGFLLSILRSSS
jgi:hypothetical protein